MSKLASRILALAGAVALALPAAVAAAPVKIGFINTITGPQAPIGENLTNGMELAVEDLKKKGADVQVIKQDDTGKPDKAISAIEQLATGDEVSVVVGPYTSACAAAVAKQSEQYAIPQVIPAASKEDITRQGYKWVFRLNAPGHVYAQSLIDAALSFGKPKTVAFIYESTDFGSSLSKVGKEYAAKKGLTVVADEGYQAGSPDYRSTLTKVKAANPDLVFMVSYVADAILLMRQSREVGLKPQAFLGGGAGFDTAQFEKEAEISTNVFSVTQWTPDSSKASEEFAKRYEAKFGKRPTYHAACAYTAMMVAGEAAVKAGGDRVKTRDALQGGTWSNIMGTVDFQDFDGFNNQNKVVMPVTQYQGGKSLTVYPANLSKGNKAVYPFPGWK
ncbi:MAG: ABC transporter substrate-binding protein [Anaeromyxobacter sp.]|nr:ABC transporter substrate-binding protein [Anaeromyxobacter sp.]MBL0274748.1 ABC transporter substrate-binding protein [Anaeromyxobacter sp.]